MAPLMLGDTELENPRLRQLLGPAGVLLHPLYGLGLILIACLPLVPLASQPAGVLLAAISTYLMLMAVRLEQPWLAITPLPPLTVLCLGAWLRCGLGGLLLAIGKPMALEEGNSAYWRHLPAAQILWLIFMVAVIGVFAIWPRSKAPTTRNKKVNCNALVKLGLACGLFAIASVVVGVISGTLDRNPSSYMYWVTQRWRPDSFFTMFARFRDVFFLLTPLAISRAQHNWQRLALASMVIGYIALALPMGGRGLLLYPILYAVFGTWMTSFSVRGIRLIIGITLTFALVAIPSIETYRGMADLQKIDRNDFAKRLELLASSTGKVSNSFDVAKAFQRAGTSLYGCSDSYLFDEPARSRPRSGFHRMEALLTAWLPELLVPKMVPVRDSHIIAEEIRGRSRAEAETMTYNSFSCVSLGGDLYWRGGWLFVAIGSTLAAFAYRLASGLWYRYSGWDSTWKILVLLYPATFLTLYPAGSIGETAWLWMWDLPKYILAISMATLITHKLPSQPTL